MESGLSALASDAAVVRSTSCRKGAGARGQHHDIGFIAQSRGLRCTRDPDGHSFAPGGHGPGDVLRRHDGVGGGDSRQRNGDSIDHLAAGGQPVLAGVLRGRRELPCQHVGVGSTDRERAAGEQLSGGGELRGGHNSPIGGGRGLQRGRQSRPGGGQRCQRQRERAAGRWRRDLPGGGELRAGDCPRRWRLGTSTGTARPTWPWPTIRQQRERAAGQWRRDLPGGGELRGGQCILVRWRSGTSTGTARPTWPWPTTISNNVSVLLGNGDGTFQAAVNYAAGRS